MTRVFIKKIVLNTTRNKRNKRKETKETKQKKQNKRNKRNKKQNKNAIFWKLFNMAGRRKKSTT